MSFEEMHSQMDVLMDKTTMPWLDPLQKDVYLNLALDDWPHFVTRVLCATLGFNCRQLDNLSTY